MKLNGKRIIVTGGSSGMGAAAVKKLSEEGAQVAVLDLTVPENTAFDRVTYFKCNVSQKAEVFETVRKAVETLGGLDGLFCIAGVNHFISAEELTEEEIDETVSSFV